MFFFKKLFFYSFKKESALLIKRYFHVSILYTAHVYFKYSEFLKILQIIFFYLNSAISMILRYNKLI